MKKKILHVIESTATGTLSAMRGLANSQINDGNYVSIIYSKRADTPKNLSNYFSPQISLINIQMSSIPNILISFIKIFKFILKFNPHYIFLASSKAGFIGRIVGLFVNKKILFFYIPHCISYIRKDISSLKKIIFISLELIASLKKCVIIAVSKSELKQIQKFIKFSPSFLVENAVTSEYLNLRIPKKKNRNIITVGGIRPQKDPESFAKIAKKIMEIDNTISFTWIGDGDSKSKKLLLESGVLVTGWLDTSEVKNRLLNSTLYLSTAKWEGMPVSLLEALACGLPVIAFNCLGNADIIKGRDIGFVFNRDDNVVNETLNLINDEEKIHRMSAAACTVVNDWFNLNRNNREINNIIKKTEEDHKL
ncbi:glycosyltransferase [Candidatus Pelagibacter sp. Uisw_113]|uniref:glycosyltransferase n=1 Tax=Candidatus Pelagibacter sp. Uisw_113 TaxID=3230994 RepID=UPI0039E799B1